MSQRAVLVIGASSGIGFTLVKEFAMKGWKVHAASRNVEMAGLKYHGIHVIQMDTTVDQSIISARDLIEQENNGRLDVLYLNAGIGRAGSLFDIQLDVVKSIFETNVFGPLKVIQVFQHILVHNKASVAFISSAVVHNVLPFSFAYAASKTSFDILARMLAIECADFDIKVINIRTGAVESEIWAPPLRASEDSLFYTGTDEPLTKFEVSKMDTAVYASKALNDVQRSIRRKPFYNETYRGTGALGGWFMGTMLPFSSYRSLILMLTNSKQPLQRARDRVWKEQLS